MTWTLWGFLVMGRFQYQRMPGHPRPLLPETRERGWSTIPMWPKRSQGIQRVILWSFQQKTLTRNVLHAHFTIPKPHSTDFQIVLSKGFGNPRGTWVRVWRVGVRVWNVWPHINPYPWVRVRVYPQCYPWVKLVCTCITISNVWPCLY